MTAVITKYRSSFDTWVANHPEFANPVHISCMEDIGDQHFFFVKSISNCHRVFNYPRVIEECHKRKNLYVGIISDEPVEVKRYNKKHKSVAVLVYDVKSANKYHYSNVFLGKYAKKLKNAIDLLCICETRFVRMPL